MDSKIPLNEMIQTLREELEEAQQQTKGSSLIFSLDSVELELSVAVTKTGTGKGGIKFWVIEAGGEYQSENAMIHKFTLKLKPNDSFPINLKGNSKETISDK